MEPAEGGELLGRYRLIRELGRGGMGVVWLADDTRLDGEIALKKVSFTHLAPEQAAGSRRRTETEARAAWRLRHHKNVITIYNVEPDPDEDALWLVLEYLPSHTLADELYGPTGLDTSRPAPFVLPPAQAARVMAVVADALAGGHEQGIVHRDVKPGNVLHGLDGSVKLTDYGISYLDGDERLTGTGHLVGSAPWAPPEWARGQLGSDAPTPAADVWSLGATLYHLVEGDPPFGWNPDLLPRIADGRINDPAVAGPVRTVLLALLQDDPATRPDAATAAARLRRAADQLDGATRPTGTTVTPTPAVRRAGPGRVALVMGALLVVAVLGVLALAVTLPAHRAAAPPASTRVVPAVPVVPVAVTGDPRDADPCGLVDLDALARLGPVRETQSYLLQGCEARVAAPGGAGEARLTVAFAAGTDPAGLPGSPDHRGTVTLTHEGPSPAGCVEDLSLSDRTLVRFSADHDTDTAAGVDLCRLAGTAADAAVADLAVHPSIPTVPGRTARWVIAGDDACAAVGRQALLDVAGRDADVRAPGFAGWGCYWGERRPGVLAVQLDFRLDDTAALPRYGSPTVVDGRTAYLARTAGTDNPEQCTAYVLHRPPAAPGAPNEVFTLGVEGPQPVDDLCRRATALAADADRHLATG